jgi:hypothetical protein
MLDILNKCYDLTEFLKDVPSEDEAAKIYTDFMNDVAKRSENAAFNKAGFAPEANPNYAAEQPRTTSVNAAEYFGGATPATASFQKPVAEAAAPTQSGDDELLNFAKASKAAPVAAPAAPAPAEQLPQIEDDGDLPF